MKRNLYGCKQGSEHGRSQDFFSGGTLFQKIFEKIFKRFSKNCKKFKQFSKIFKKISKNIQKFFKKIRKFSKIFLRKLIKCIILAWFSHNLTRHGVKFCAFGRKTQFAENF